jgi:hypothetical protein
VVFQIFQIPCDRWIAWDSISWLELDFGDDFTRCSATGFSRKMGFLHSTVLP